MRGVIMAEKKKKPYEIGELDQYLFGQGNHYEIYKKLGAHLVQDGKQKGVYFAVWAPHAQAVSVVGEFKRRTSGNLYLFYTWCEEKSDV